MGEYKDKIKGRAKQIVGRATGNSRMEGEGIGLQTRGVVRGAVKYVKRAFSRRIRRRTNQPD